MGRGVYRGVHSSLFDDPDFQRLSPQARQVFLTIRLCKDAGPAVIFRYYPEVIARQTGLSLRHVEAAMLELERPPLTQAPWIIREGVVVWVRNGLLHDPSLRLNSVKHRSAVIRQLQGLPRGPIIAKFCEYYKITEPINSLSDSGSRWATCTGSESEVLPETEILPETEDLLPPAEPAAAAAPSWGSAEQLVALYNRLAPNGHPRVTKLSTGRRRKARQYLAEFPEQTFWVGVFTELALSRFLQHGSRDSPGFKGDFDWLLTKGKDGSENAVKVFEGRYRDKEHG